MIFALHFVPLSQSAMRPLERELSRRLSQSMQIVEGIKTRGVPIRPDRLNGVSAYGFDPEQNERGRRIGPIRTFVEIAQDIALALAAGAGTRFAQQFEADKTFAAVFPLNGQFLANDLNILRSHQG